MNAVQIISLVTGILGALLGTAGLIISIRAFLRDRPKITVTLNWDLEPIAKPLPIGVSIKKPDRIGVVSVTNVGRRAIHIVVVGLELPKHYEYDMLILKESMPGRRLGEGDPPAKYAVTHDKMDKYKADWKKLRAFAEDGAGKKYYSKFPQKKPSWAG